MKNRKQYSYTYFSIIIIITLTASSGKRNVTVWCPSVRPSVFLSRLFFLTLIGCPAHT